MVAAVLNSIIGLVNHLGGKKKKNQLLVNLRSEVRSFICSSEVTRHRYTISRRFLYSRHHSKIR